MSKLLNAQMPEHPPLWSQHHWALSAPKALATEGHQVKKNRFSKVLQRLRERMFRKMESQEEEEGLTTLPLVPAVIFLCRVVQFSVNSTWQPGSLSSLIAPSHPMVATQLQIKHAHVLGNFTEPCLVLAASSLMPHKDCTWSQKSNRDRKGKRLRWTNLYFIHWIGWKLFRILSGTLFFNEIKMNREDAALLS